MSFYQYKKAEARGELDGAMSETSRLIDRLGRSKNFGGFPGERPSSVEELAAMVNRALDEPHTPQDLSGHGPFTPITVTAATETKERPS